MALTKSNDSRGFTNSRRQTLLRYLELGWSPTDIARELNTTTRTVYNYRDRWCRTGSMDTRWQRRLGRPRQLTLADEDALVEHLHAEGWLYHGEMVSWLSCERGVVVTKSTICRMLKRRKLPPRGFGKRKQPSIHNKRQE